jgi:hypothetical protein
MNYITYIYIYICPLNAPWITGDCAFVGIYGDQAFCRSSSSIRKRKQLLFPGEKLWLSGKSWAVYIYTYTYVNTYIYIYICKYIYIYIGIVSLRASVLSPFRSSWTRTLLGGLWNVHNSYETCTTSMERAQLLWNVRNSYETCATSMIYISSQTLQKALNDTIPIYTYIYRVYPIIIYH